jgi:hypothetical protein
MLRGEEPGSTTNEGLCVNSLSALSPRESSKAVSKAAPKGHSPFRTGDPIDRAKVRRLLGDFRLLYEAATDDERAELLKLLIARIDFHGKNANVVVTFRDDVKLTAPVRSYEVKWLPELGSNQRRLHHMHNQPNSEDAIAHAGFALF